MRSRSFAPSIRSKSFRLLLTISVPMWPGITTDTPTCGAFTRKSSSSASVKPFTANLAAL